MLTIRVDGLREATALLGGLQRDIPYAASVALNSTGFDVRRKLQQQAQVVFDRPTPYITHRTLRVWSQATKQDLHATVGWDYIGGKGGDPSDTLRSQVTGGGRGFKRFERALHRAGILPSGMYAVPGGAAPLDAYGNVQVGWLIKLLSYMRAFGEQGYRANITDKGRAKMAGRKRTERGFVRIEGVEYFVSRGKGETRRGQMQHLPAGIWSRKGIHGSDIAPVLMFVRRPSYAARLPAERIAVDTAMASFPRHYAAALDRASRSSRK